MVAVAFVIQLDTRNAWIPGAYGFPGFTSLFAVTACTVGAVVVARQPANPIGLLLLVAGLGFAFQSLYNEYAIAAYLVASGGLPLAQIAAWLLAWAWLPQVLLVGPVLLSIFPDGHILSRRWALGPVLAAIAGVVFAVLGAFARGPLQNFALVTNPFGFIPLEIADQVIPALALLLAVGFVISAASLVVRYRRSGPDRRLQLKWIAVAAVILAAAAPLGFGLGKPGQVVFIVALCGIPAATGIAILRYRLYEIDTIINRALVYGLLTAIVAGIYAASVGVMQRLSGEFLGGSSEATIVVTTVLIVTAFTPIKTRLQTFVDRRFKDAGDAKSVLEPFTKALHERLWPVETSLVLRRFAEVLLAALRAARVEVREERTGAPGIVGIATSDVVPGAPWSTASTVGPVTLRLTATLGKHEVSPRDLEAVNRALEAVARELPQ